MKCAALLSQNMSISDKPDSYAHGVYTISKNSATQTT